MNISKPFVPQGPVATCSAHAGLGVGEVIAYDAGRPPLPQVDFPTISVSASLPGASPETMASSVATPLERQFGRIAAVTEMTSASYLGSCSITLQFDLNRNIDAAARDVQAAIAAALAHAEPADEPFVPEGESSRFSHFHARAHLRYPRPGQDVRRRVDDHGAKAGAGPGRGRCTSVEALCRPSAWVNPAALNKYGIGLEDMKRFTNSANANVPKGVFRWPPDVGSWRQRPVIQGGRLSAADRRLP